MTVTLRLLKFGRLLCMCQHLSRISGLWDNRNLVICLQNRCNSHYTNSPCGLYETWTRFPDVTGREDNPYPNRPLCPDKDSNSVKKDRSLLCYPLHHRGIAGTARFELATFGLTGRSYFHTSYIPMVAGGGIEPPSTGLWDQSGNQHPSHNMLAH